tara:strand:+ start:208 stop:681 length:474 start_codon:yes stop_codon:yes gene_type:complete
MIAETLAGIALVKSAVDGIKSVIGTANDIGDIAGHIDNLFAGEKQVQQQRSKKSGVGMGDQFGVGSVAREVLDARIAQEKMQEIATMVDMRFGHGTWKGILAERQKRIQEAKEAAIKARREAIKRQQELLDNIKIAVGICCVAALGFGFIMFAVFST